MGEHCCVYGEAIGAECLNCKRVRERSEAIDQAVADERARIVAMLLARSERLDNAPRGGLLDAQSLRGGSNELLAMAKRIEGGEGG